MTEAMLALIVDSSNVRFASLGAEAPDAQPWPGASETAPGRRAPLAGEGFRAMRKEAPL